MTTVVIVYYERADVFSTPRKALEYVANQGWKAFIDSEYDDKGHIVGSIMIDVTTQNVVKLITHLNAKEFLTLYSEDDRSQCQLTKAVVK